MKISVIGGDKRMLFAAKTFFDDGFDVAVAGFDELVSLCGIRVMSIGDAVNFADIIVLPVRPVKDGALSAPYTERKTDISELMSVIGDKPVFSGCAELLKPYDTGLLFDYAARESFTYRNAELTAEGALSIVLNDYEGSVFGSKCLVVGYGRIGKLLSRYLRALGADVTVAARKERDRALASLTGLKAARISDIRFEEYDIIFNTVPALVIDKTAVDRMRDDVFIIDLASAPGGVDFAAAGQRGLTCIHALSLPGKTAPSAAGRIIKDTIIEILKEESGGKDNFGLRDDRLLLHLR